MPVFNTEQGKLDSLRATKVEMFGEKASGSLHDNAVLGISGGVVLNMRGIEFAEDQ